MFGFSLKNQRCCFCGRKEGFFHSVSSYGIYGTVAKRVFYHPQCLEQVQLNPERFPHAIVDMAIFISDNKPRCIDHNKEIIEKYKNKIKKLKADHFLSMIPDD